MKINVMAVRELIKEKFDNKVSKFVKEIQVDYSYANQILNGHKSPESKKICDGIILYCKKNNIDYHKYIFF